MATTTLTQMSSSQLPLDLAGLKLSSVHSRSFIGASQTPIPSGLVSSMSSHKRTKFKLEPLKVLEPSQKKLTLPEAQRLMYILEELIHKLEMLEYLPLVLLLYMITEMSSYYELLSKINPYSI
jgi:hypothetical protein